MYNLPAYSPPCSAECEECCGALHPRDSVADRAREKQDYSMVKSYCALPVKEIKYLGVKLTQEVKDSTMKTLNLCRRKRFRKTPEKGKISCAHRLVALIV